MASMTRMTIAIIAEKKTIRTTKSGLEVTVDWYGDGVALNMALKMQKNHFI